MEYKDKRLTYMEYQAMNENLSGLIAGFNGVDKVHTVPIPFPYAQMIVVLLSACAIPPRHPRPAPARPRPRL